MEPRLKWNKIRLVR